MKKPIFTNSLFCVLLILLFSTTEELKAQFPTDLGITAISTPVTSCEIEIDTVTVTLFNFGTVPQSLIPFRFSVNGEEAGIPQPLDGFYTGILSPDSMITLSFETIYDFSEDGIYEIKAWTEVETDMDITNDTFTYILENIPTTNIFPYVNTFGEPTPTEWYPDEENSLNSSLSFGTPNAPIINSAYTQEMVYVTNPDGQYNNNELSYLLSPCMDFSNFSEDPTFRCAINYEMETNYDGAWLEGSINGGDWIKIGAIGSGTNWYNEDFFTQGDLWNGNSDGWLIAENVMDGFAGESDVHLRFVFDSDGSVLREGFAVDDISIFGCLIDFNTTFDITNASQDNTSDGAISILGSQGVSPFTYSWSNGATTASISDLMPGEYTLTIVDALGCSDEITVEVGVGLNVATNDLEKETAIKLYPNPTDGMTLLELELSQASDFTVAVINSTGQTVAQLSETNAISGTYPMDLSNLPTGLYFVQISINGKMDQVERLLIF